MGGTRTARAGTWWSPATLLARVRACSPRASVIHGHACVHSRVSRCVRRLAGSAVLTSLLLRGKYEPSGVRVFCWAFACPGGLVSPRLSDALAYGPPPPPPVAAFPSLFSLFIRLVLCLNCVFYPLASD